MTTMKKAATVTCLALLTLVSITLNSCKKSAPEPSSTGSDATTLALTSGTWKLSLWEAKHQDGTWLSLIMDNERTSQRITYHADHTFASSGLYQSAMVYDTGTWKFANEETTVVKTYANQSGPPVSTTFSIISGSELQEKEVDILQWLPPEITGSSTDTLFYGFRYTWKH